MTTHEEFRELVAGHALSALEPGDEHLVLSHLAACAPCSRELVSARETIAHLAYGVDPVEPPADLFAGIRAQVVAQTPDAFAVPTVVQHAEVVELAPRRHRRLETRAAKIVAAAASISVAAVVGLGAWNISLHRDNMQQGEISASVQSALDLLTTEGGQMVVLRSADQTVDAVAVVHGSRIDLVTDGVARNSATTRYVLWGQSSDVNRGLPKAIGAFSVDDAHVDTVKAIAASGDVPEKLIISLEPGAVAAPLPTNSTTVVATGAV